MGPNDPYASAGARPSAPPARAGRGPLDPLPSAPPRREPRRGGLLLGLGLGLLFGLLVLVWGFGAALLVGVCGAAGAGIGYAAHALAADRLDVAAAWRALRRER